MVMPFSSRSSLLETQFNLAFHKGFAHELAAQDDFGLGLHLILNAELLEQHISDVGTARALEISDGLGVEQCFLQPAFTATPIRETAISLRSTGLK